MGSVLVLRAVRLPLWGGRQLFGVVVCGVGMSSIGRLGPLGCIRYRTSTCGLSTWWSSTALRETSFRGWFPA